MKDIGENIRDKILNRLGLTLSNLTIKVIQLGTQVIDNILT